MAKLPAQDSVERLLDRAKFHSQRAVECATTRPFSDNEHKTSILLSEAAATISRLTADNEALREALTPSADTKAAYWGEFYMGVTLRAGRQEDYRRVQIPWNSIKEIMAAISARAALGDRP